jgi:D-amino-acid dehydrogenase
VVLAFGHGHVGLGASARTGLWVARLMAGLPPDESLSAFSPARFQPTRPAVGFIVLR